MSISDKFEKQVFIKAPQSRVWRAITDSKEFSAWFGVTINGSFEPGKTVTGSFAEGLNEEMIMEHQRKNGIKPSKIKMPEENAIFCTVEKMEPEHYFSFRWIPYGIDAEADPENEPTTLVEFFLDEEGGGTRLKIAESGFDRVPAHRRERAFRMNEGGWAAQALAIQKYAESK